ncbi:hypothetical protein STEG23_019286, partial [Scotinomys teguina]
MDTSPDCYRDKDPDLASSSSDLDDTMVSGGNTGHPDLHGPSSGMALIYQQGH